MRVATTPTGSHPSDAQDWQVAEAAAASWHGRSKFHSARTDGAQAAFHAILSPVERNSETSTEQNAGVDEQERKQERARLAVTNSNSLHSGPSESARARAALASTSAAAQQPPSQTEDAEATRLTHPAESGRPMRAWRIATLRKRLLRGGGRHSPAAARRETPQTQPGDREARGRRTITSSGETYSKA